MVGEENIWLTKKSNQTNQMLLKSILQMLHTVVFREQIPAFGKIVFGYIKRHFSLIHCISNNACTLKVSLSWVAFQNNMAWKVFILTKGQLNQDQVQESPEQHHTEIKQVWHTSQHVYKIGAKGTRGHIKVTHEQPQWKLQPPLQRMCGSVPDCHFIPRPHYLETKWQ